MACYYHIPMLPPIDVFAGKPSKCTEEKFDGREYERNRTKVYDICRKEERHNMALTVAIVVSMIAFIVAVFLLAN